MIITNQWSVLISYMKSGSRELIRTELWHHDQFEAILVPQVFVSHCLQICYMIVDNYGWEWMHSSVYMYCTRSWTNILSFVCMCFPTKWINSFHLCNTAIWSFLAQMIPNFGSSYSENQFSFIHIKQTVNCDISTLPPYL